MAKNDTKKSVPKLKVLDYDDKSLSAAGLSGRNDLLPEDVHIPGPYGGAVKVSDGSGEIDVDEAIRQATGQSSSAGSATGDDGNTPAFGGTPE